MNNPQAHEKTSLAKAMLMVSAWALIVFGTPLLLATSCDPNDVHAISVDPYAFYGGVATVLIIALAGGVMWFIGKIKDELNGDKFLDL
jgi:hypothetical protein